MKNKLAKVIPIILCTTAISPLFCTINAFADSSSTMSTTQVKPVEKSSATDKLADNTISKNNKALDVQNKPNREPLSATDVVPNVSVDKATHWATNKGSDAITFLQSAVRPIAIIVFIISALVALCGGVFGGNAVTKGLIGMGISVFMFTAVTFAPDLVNFFSNWLAG